MPAAAEGARGAAPAECRAGSLPVGSGRREPSDTADGAAGDEEIGKMYERNSGVWCASCAPTKCAALAIPFVLRTLTHHTKASTQSGNR